MLSPKEKEKIENLPKEFNIVPEPEDFNLMAFKRTEISKVWTRRLLFATVLFNLISIVFMVLSIGVAFMKPEPEFYASTPSGRVIFLETLRN